MLWIVLFVLVPDICRSQLTHECNSMFYNEPKCIDHPMGYYCNCGPGFIWNSKKCIAAGIDSMMVFQAVNSTYTLVDRKDMPREFTVSLWVRARSAGVLMSLVNSNTLNESVSQVSISLEQTSYNTCSAVIQYLSTEWHVPRPIPFNHWSHLAWSQKLFGRNAVKWVTYLDAEYKETVISKIPETLKGEIILGQLSKSFKSRLKDSGFAGEMAHFHVWNFSMTEAEMKDIHHDCIYNYCGNVVQWSEFRYGTRGHLQLKWPSGIKVKRCLDTFELIRSCDLSCSRHIGAQCKVEIKANIEWERTKANSNYSNFCPMPNKQEASFDNSSAKIDGRPRITRFCEETASKEGRWAEPDINACISDEWRILLKKSKELQELVDQCILNDSNLIDGLVLFHNLTERLTIINAMDLSLCIYILDIFTLLKEKQELRCPRFMIEIAQIREEIHQNQYTIIKLVMKIANNLVDSKNVDSWNYTRPSGFEGRKLLGVLKKFYQMTTVNVNNLIIKYFYMPREMDLLLNEANIILKLKAIRWSNFKGVAFPDSQDIKEISDEWVTTNEFSSMALSRDFLIDTHATQISLNPTNLIVIAVIYRDVALKATHTIDPEQLKMKTGSLPFINQRLNSDVMDMTASVDGRVVDKIKAKSLKINFLYKDYFNISNTNCLSMSGDYRETNIYSTSRPAWIGSCSGQNFKTESVMCVCDQLGIFSVATDMFNELWKKKKLPNNLLALPSYFGCTVSVVLCFVSLVMLIYLRTSSITSAIHKHFSMAIVAGQISYMFGIDKYEHKITCRIFSLSLHYFFLACFTWLMNEAFNLYIVITYAAHSHGDNTDGHMWRFYLLGWVMPAILVAAVAGINKANYYSQNMCWINQKDVWLFYGPAIAVIAVSILVLVFTTKEHHESSYTKNEKDNKAIINQAKAIWTQIILLTLSWSFAFICVRMQEIIVKYLFGLFNSLQGAFYIVFYYLLNDEVQNIYSERKNKGMKRKASEQVDDVVPDLPFVCYTEAYPNTEIQSESTPTQERQKRRRSFFSNVIENLNIRTRRFQNKGELGDQGNNDNSDYELITSV